jgi:hypothetical protein
MRMDAHLCRIAAVLSLLSTAGVASAQVPYPPAMYGAPPVGYPSMPGYGAPAYMPMSYGPPMGYPVAPVYMGPPPGVHPIQLPQAPPGPPGPPTPPPGYMPGPIYDDPVVPQTNYAPPKQPSTKVEVDYILWWLSRSPVNSTLLTRGDAADAVPGALGQPGTAALFGAGGQNYSAASGIRLSFETWEPSEQVFGFSVSGFWVAPQIRRDQFSNDGSNSAAGLYLPYFDPNAASNNAILLAGQFSPGVTSVGSFTATSKIEFWGADVNGLYNFVRTEGWSIDGLLGVKYLQLDEGLTLETMRADSDGLFFRTSSEHFQTRNQFVGGTIGGRGELRFGNWTTSLLSTFSFGNNFQNLMIDGQAARSGGQSAVNGVTPGFVYVQPSNMGRFAGNEFGFVSTLQAKAGYQFTQRLRGLVGYEFTYWTGVLRPGNQIDSTVNLSQSPFGAGTLSGAARPTVPLIDSDFWAHGLTIGLEYRY